jgi:hypothetical protein
MEDRYSFLVEWYDTAAAIYRQYNLLYYPQEKSYEMVNNTLKL